MSVADQLRSAKVAAGTSRRSALSRIIHSRYLRWRYGSPAITQLVIVPQDLRTADPSFWHEIELGQFGLAGTMAELKGRSPFELPPPNEGWARELHGFGWLRHLNAAANDQARATARELTTEWIIRHRGGDGIAWEPAVAGRRLISWLSHAGLLLDGADPKTYEAITQSLGSQLARLSATRNDSAQGYPRLLALIALVLADLSIAGHDKQLGAVEWALAQELATQIQPDGGHVTRNPSILIEIMLDLLPLRQCFAARARRQPEALTTALRRIPAMLRFMRLGDGMLGHFNGVAAGVPAGLATVLAYDDRQDAQPGLAPNARYARLSRGNTVLLLDAGTPPPLDAAMEAHAGCLSFEMSVGTRAMFVNGGAPAPADASWRAMARATANHNTLCIAETSSSQMVHNKRLNELSGTVIKGPYVVDARVTEADYALEAVMSHDGYREKFGLIHSRDLALSSDGRKLTGIDRLAGPRVRVRLRQDLPFAIHFHLHPEAGCKLLSGENAAEIRLRDGQIWRFSAASIVPSVEESTYFADSAGPREALQIVLRSSTFGESDIPWTIEAVTP